MQDNITQNIQQQDIITLYLVGGTVRDELMGKKPNDIDYAVEAKSYQHMKRHLSNHNFQIYVEKPEFGTLKAKCPKTNVVSDYTLCRKDGVYTDHRRPDTIELADIQADLSRRDFTMNAIAKIKQEDGSDLYFDPFNGRYDIERKLIRCVGSAEERLAEDPLRGLRAIRFMVLMQFSIDPAIWTAMSKPMFLENFKSLTKERIRGELYKMFQADTLRSLDALNCLREIQPGIIEWIFINVGIWLMPTLKDITKKRNV